MVDDLLEVSRITRGQIELKRERCTVATLVAQALETSQPLISSASHTVAVALPPEALAGANCSARRPSLAWGLLSPAELR